MSKCSKAIRLNSAAVTASKGAPVLADARYIRVNHQIFSIVPDVGNGTRALIFTGQTVIRGSKDPVPSVSKAKAEMRRLIPGHNLKPGQLRVTAV